MTDAAPPPLTLPARALTLVEFPGYVRDPEAATAALGGREVCMCMCVCVCVCVCGASVYLRREGERKRADGRGTADMRADG